MANLFLIKQFAEKKNIAITELANIVGVSEQQIHLMVRKNSTKIETLEKIAKALEVPVSCFFEEDDVEVRAAGRDYVEKGKIEHHGAEYNAPMTCPSSELEKENAELKQKLIDAQERIIKLMEERK